MEVKSGTLGRKKSKVKLNKPMEEANLYTKKRELEKKIDEEEAEIEKGNLIRKFEYANWLTNRVTYPHHANVQSS